MVTRVCLLSSKPVTFAFNHHFLHLTFLPKAEEWRKEKSRRGGQPGAEVEKEERKEEVAGREEALQVRAVI